MNKKQIISFYSKSSSQGQRTVSLAFANLLAQQSYDVLYVELDTHTPTIARALKIMTEEKNMLNYLKQTAKGDFDGIQKFVLGKQDIIQHGERKEKRIYSGLEETLSYLVFPMDVKQVDIPDLIDSNRMRFESAEEYAMDYVTQFVDELHNSPFDFIVCKLPNDIDHLFTVEMMKKSDHIVSVSLPSITKIVEQKETKRFLFEQMKELETKWHDVFNMTSQEIPNAEYNQLLETKCIIPFDPERQKEELSLQPDSELIRQSLERFVLDLGISINVTMEKDSRSIFHKVLGGKG